MPRRRNPAPVYAFDNSGALAASYPDAVTAAKELGLFISSVTIALKTGGRARGLRLSYAPTPLPPYKRGQSAPLTAERRYRTRGVEAQGAQGEARAYGSAAEAAQALGLSRHAVYGLLASGAPFTHPALGEGSRLRWTAPA